jgi:predicted kinase
VAQLVHLNGPPGIGKSTLSALYADRHPGTLNLDVDAVHQLIDGWADEDNRTWEVVAPLVLAMAGTQLDGGRDVVVPQYHAAAEEITALEDVAHEHGAAFREVVLLDDRTAAIERFDRRARDDDDPYISTCTATSGCAAASSDSERCMTTCWRSCLGTRGPRWCPARPGRSRRPTRS